LFSAGDGTIKVNATEDQCMGERAKEEDWEKSVFKPDVEDRMTDRW